MRRIAPALFVAPLLLAASAPVARAPSPISSALERARAEQAAAAAEARRLEQVAAKAQGEAARLRAEQAAAAQALEAAEARITVADAELRALAVTLAAHRAELQRRQQPISSLLAGLAMMARRPPLIAIAEQASTDDYVKVWMLLDSTLPVIRRRTAALSAELASDRQLERQTAGARKELAASRQDLLVRRERFAALEQRAIQSADRAGGQALNAGDVALAAGEDIGRLRNAEIDRRSAWATAAEVEALDPAPQRPVAGTETGPAFPTIAYRLPALAPLTDGWGEVSRSGVKSRGTTLATARGAPIVAPASGVIRFSGPFGQHDGVVIIDHGGGWKSLLLDVSSPLKVGQRVTIGQPLGRALGPISVELSQNGRRLSPALIAGSSGSLSNARKGG
jgi:septal ring factor EnvC (AmiA/AmiB activator)